MAGRKKDFEKNTRLLIERTSDMVKPGKDGNFKFKKASRKIIKSIKRNCCHWVFIKGRPETAVTADPENPGNWKCGICKAVFPMAPLVRRGEPGEEGYTPGYTEVLREALAVVNQILLWRTGMGGNKEDLKTMLELKRYLPKMVKIANKVPEVLQKKYNKSKNIKANTNLFDMYSGWNYNRCR